MPQAPPTLSALERELFDPRKDPLLRPGFVTPDYVATQAELQAAAALLVYRRAHYGWRLDPLDDETRESLRACLETEAESAAPALPAANGDAPAVESDERAIERRLGGLLPWRPLPFYPGGRLVHIPASGNGAAPPAAAERIILHGGEGTPRTARLDGKSLPIHQFNKAAPFHASVKGALEEYVSFFTEHVHGSEGGFYVIEEAGLEGATPDVADAEPLLAADQPLPEYYHLLRDHRRSGELAPEDLSRFAAALDQAGPPVRALLAHPITRIAPPSHDPDRAYFIATMLYARSPFRAVLAIERSGMIEMLEDPHVADTAIGPLSPRWLPPRSEG